MDYFGPHIISPNTMVKTNYHHRTIESLSTISQLLSLSLESMGGSVKDVQSKQELDDLVRTGAPVILHFWASWCEASKHMDKVFSHLSVDFPLLHFLRVSLTFFFLQFGHEVYLFRVRFRYCSLLNVVGLRLKSNLRFPRLMRFRLYHSLSSPRYGFRHL